MNEREAQEITRMVESGWNCDFGPQGRTLWCRMLYSFEAEMATEGVVEMSRFPLPGGRFTPQVSDLRQILVSLRSRTRKGIEETIGKRGEATPEWVWVWSWARFNRNPPEERAFPQQEMFANPDNLMPKSVYEQLLAEWRNAGSPKSKNPLPAALR